jgi:site-specific recombinase XerD
MQPLDIAIDDYMHVIARTRPWTIKHEEAYLEAFSAWLYEQPNGNVLLTEIDTAHLHSYATDAALSPAEQDDLRSVLNNVYCWSAHQGWIEHNPFRVGSD